MKKEETLAFGKLSADAVNAAFNAEYLRLIKLDIAEAQNHLDELPEDQMRGLQKETLRHFHGGYLKDWVMAKCRAQYACGLYVKKDGTPKRLPPPSERIIIPTLSGNHFNAVATPRARSKMAESHRKQHQGDEELFYDPDNFSADTVALVEGEFDMMTLWEILDANKFAVAATLGCSNQKKTVGNNLKGILKGKRFVLLFDGDASGRKGAEKLRDMLIRERVPAVVRFLVDYLPLELKKVPDPEKIDFNDVLRYYGAEMLERIMQRVLENTDAELDAVAAQIEKETAAAGQNDANPQLEVKSTARQEKQSAPTRDNQSVNPADDDEARRIIRVALKFIPLADKHSVTRDDWFKIGAIMKRYGMEFGDFDAWSKTDSARYNAADCKAQWDSMWTADQTPDTPGKSLNLGTLIHIAKQFGYEPPAPMDDLEDDDGQPRTQDIIKSCPVNLRIPRGYEWNLRGVTKLISSKKETAAPLSPNAPIARGSDNVLPSTSTVRQTPRNRIDSS